MDEEIEVTEKMLVAGVCEIVAGDPDDASDLAARVYKEMEKVRRQSCN